MYLASIASVLCPVIQFSSNLRGVEATAAAGMLAPWLRWFGLNARHSKRHVETVQIGLGGYVVGRSTEKLAEKVAEVMKQ